MKKEEYYSFMKAEGDILDTYCTNLFIFAIKLDIS